MINTPNFDLQLLTFDSKLDRIRAKRRMASIRQRAQSENRSIPRSDNIVSVPNMKVATASKAGKPLAKAQMQATALSNSNTMDRPSERRCKLLQESRTC